VEHSGIEPQIPKTTSGEWKFFQHIDAKPGTNLLVSAWLWESSREALVLNPRCLDWLWKWRKKFHETIKEALDGCDSSIRRLYESEPGVRLSAWMISPDFPE